MYEHERWPFADALVGDLEPVDLNDLDPERTRRCLVGQLERLGRTVTLEETAVTA
jgi:hypothetical protein